MNIIVVIIMKVMMFFIRPGHLLIILVTILQQQSRALPQLRTESPSTTTEWDLLPSYTFQSYSTATPSPSLDVKNNPMTTRNSEELTSSDLTSIEISNGNFNKITIQKHSVTEDSTRVLSMTSTQSSIGFYPQPSRSGCLSSHCRFGPSSSFTNFGTAIPILGRPASNQLTPDSSSRRILSGSPLAGPTSAIKTSSPAFIIMADTTATTMASQQRLKRKRNKKRKKKKRKKKRKKKKSRRKGRRTTVEWGVEELRKTTRAATTEKGIRVNWVTDHRRRDQNYPAPFPTAITRPSLLKSVSFLAPVQRHVPLSSFPAEVTTQPMPLPGVAEKPFQTIKSTSVFEGFSIQQTMTFPNLLSSRSLLDQLIRIKPHLPNTTSSLTTQTSHHKELNQDHLHTASFTNPSPKNQIPTPIKNSTTQESVNTHNYLTSPTSSLTAQTSHHNELNQDHLHTASFTNPSTKNQIPTPITNPTTQESLNTHNYVTSSYFKAKSSSESTPFSQKLNTLSSSFSFHSIHKSDFSELQSPLSPLNTRLGTTFSSLKDFPNKDSMLQSKHPIMSSNMESLQSKSFSLIKIPIHPTPSEQSSLSHSPANRTAYIDSTNSVNSTRKYSTLESILIFEARRPPIIEKSFEIDKQLTTPRFIDNSEFQSFPQIHSSKSFVEPELFQNVFSTVSEKSVSKTQFSSSLTPLSVSDVSENLEYMDLLSLFDTVLNYTKENSSISEELSTLSSSASPLVSSTPFPSNSVFPLSFHSQTPANYERKFADEDEQQLSSKETASKNQLPNNSEHFSQISFQSNSLDQSVYPSFSVSNPVPSSKFHSQFTKESVEAKFPSFVHSLRPTITSHGDLFSDFTLTDSSQSLTWPDVHSTTLFNNLPPLQTSSLLTFNPDPTHTPLLEEFTFEPLVIQHNPQTLGDENLVFDSEKRQNLNHPLIIPTSTTVTNNLIPSSSLHLSLKPEPTRTSGFMSSYSQENIISDNLSPFATMMSTPESSYDPVDILSSSLLEIFSSSDLTSSETSVKTTTPNMALSDIPLESSMLSITSSNKLSLSLAESHSQSLSLELTMEGSSNMASFTGDSISTLFFTPELSNLFFPSTGVTPDSWTSPALLTEDSEVFTTDSNSQQHVLVDRDVSITTEPLISSEYENENGLLSSKVLVSMAKFNDDQEFPRKETLVGSSFASDLHSQSKTSDAAWTFDLNTMEEDLFFFTSSLISSFVSPPSGLESVDSSTVQLTPYMSSDFLIESSSASPSLMLPPSSLPEKPAGAASTNDPAVSGSVEVDGTDDPFSYFSSLDPDSANWYFPFSDRFLESSQSSLEISSSHFKSVSQLSGQSLATSQAEITSPLESPESTLLTNSSSHLFSSFSFLEPSKVNPSPPTLLPMSSQVSSPIESSLLALSSLLEPTSPLSLWLDSPSFSEFEDSDLISSVMVEQSVSASQFFFEMEPSEWTSQMESSQMSELFSPVKSISIIDSIWIESESGYLSSESMLSSLLETLQPTSKLKSISNTSQISSAFTFPAMTPHQSSELTPEISIQIMSSLSSQFTPEISKDIIPFLSSQFSTEISQFTPDIVTNIMPSLSSQFSTEISQFTPEISEDIIPFLSSQISTEISQFTPDIVTNIMPSLSSQFSTEISQFTSDIVTDIMPSLSSQFSTEISQFTPDIVTDIMPSLSSQFSTEISQFTPEISKDIIPSLSSQFLTEISQFIPEISTYIIPSLSYQFSTEISQFTPEISTDIIPSLSYQFSTEISQFTPEISTDIIPSPSSQFSTQMLSHFIPNISSQLTSQISLQFTTQMSSQLTFQMSDSFQLTSQLDSSHPLLNLSTESETFQPTSLHLSSQIEFPQETMLLSSELQSLPLKSIFDSFQSASTTFQMQSQSDLSHQTSQLSSYSNFSQSSSLHPSLSSSFQQTSQSTPWFSSALDTAHLTKFSSFVEEPYYSTSDLTSQIMSSHPQSNVYSTFSLTVYSINPKLNSSSSQLETQSTLKTEMISVSSFSSTLMPTLSVTKTLNHEINSSLFYSTTKLANHTTPDADKGTNPTTPLTITLPTTLEPLLNLSQAFQNYWVITVIKVRLSVNVTTLPFRKEMERNLAQAYVEAYHRGERILNGTYQPLRKKRFALVKDVALQMINITRSLRKSSNNVTLVYYMEKTGKPVPAISAARHLMLLQPQELAIYLKQVVVLPASTYLKPPHPEPSKDWIIGAVLGTLSSALLLIWCILFIYFKCFHLRPTKSIHTKSPTPQLVLTTSMQDVNTDTSETVLIRDEMQVQRQPSLLKKNGPKKQSYSVALSKVGRKNKKEPEREESTKEVTGGKKIVKSARKIVNGKISKKAEVKPEVKINGVNDLPKQNGHVIMKHDEYSKETDNYSDYEVEPVQMLPPLSINGCISNERLSPFHYVNLPPIQHNFSLTASRQERFPRYVPQSSSDYMADDELRYQANHLRRIQKQRLKEERRKMRHVELYQNSPHFFLNQDQDMEVVGSSPRTETADESHLEESRRGSRRRRYKRREKHDMSSPEDSSLNDVYDRDETWANQPEMLQRTREKMHKLLDDAFQLIAKHERKKVSSSITPLGTGCTRRSSIGKRRTRRQRTNLLETPTVSCHRKSSPSDSAPEEKLDRLHTPLFLHNHYSPCNRHRVNSAIPPPWNAAGDEAAKIAAEHQAWSSPYVSPRLNRSTTLLDSSDPREEMRVPTISYPSDHNLTEFGCQPSFSFSRTRLSSQFSPYASSRQMFHNRHSGYHSVDNSDDTPASLFQATTPCCPTNIETNIELNTFEPPSFAKHLLRSPGSLKTSPVDDEIDVIHNTVNVKQESTPQPLIQSIREELMRLSNEKGERNSLRSRIVFS